MDLKLAAIDLDGTLLKEDCTISERNRKAICRAMELGYLHTGGVVTIAELPVCAGGISGDALLY